MDKKRRVGIFGGYRGMSFYSSIQADPDFCVVAICESSPDRIPKIMEKIGDDHVQICNSFEEMLQVGIDVVILANYFHEHCKYAIKAMENGVDVISETTAAPTLGECLDLVECWERTGRKYVLAANCPVMQGPAEMIRRYQTGEFGEVEYAEAEYLHHHPGDTDEDTAKDLYPTTYHWRRYLPGTYYNMHSMGVLMEATHLMPRRVTAMEIYTESHAAKVTVKHNKTVGAFALYEMENGALFRSNGCASCGPSGKWYRLTCEEGTIETVRVDQNKILARPNEGPYEEYVPEDHRSEAEKATSHGGADGVIWKKMSAYLSGKADEPFFGVYNAVMLSMAGIYAFYSILEGKTLDIPDIRDKKAREVLRGDYRSPFPDAEGHATLPCTTKNP